MASGSTIFKAELDISNIDHNHYERRTLTIARHPMETEGRMMLRLVAFCVWNDGTGTLAFAEGLEKGGVPAIVDRDETGAASLWVEFGTPSVKLVRRAAGRSGRVVVLSHGEEAVNTWWTSVRSDMEKIEKLSVLTISDEGFENLASMVERHIRLSITVQDGVIWVADSTRNIEIRLTTIKAGPGPVWD